jgi:hypothetical protein
MQLDLNAASKFKFFPIKKDYLEAYLNKEEEALAQASLEKIVALQHQIEITKPNTLFGKVTSTNPLLHHN